MHKTDEQKARALRAYEMFKASHAAWLESLEPAPHVQNEVSKAHKRFQPNGAVIRKTLHEGL